MRACFSYNFQQQGNDKQNFKIHVLHLASFNFFSIKPAASYYKKGMTTLSLSMVLKPVSNFCVYVTYLPLKYFHKRTKGL